MSETFKLDKKDLKKLQKFQKNAPKQFSFAARILLNDLAFGGRKAAIEMVEKKMTVRNKNFVKSAMRVQKAKGSNINSMKAIYGSIHKPRFDGWREQELGTKTKRKKTMSLFSRGGNKSGMVKGKYRSKKSNTTKLYRPENYKTRTPDGNFRFMMRVMATRGASQFLLTKPYHGKKKTLGRGVYELYKHKIERVQDFDSATQPKKNPWLRPSQLKYMQTVNLRKKWSRAIGVALKGRK